MGKKAKQNNGVIFISKDRRTKVFANGQPAPTFFSDAEKERMSHTPGSYKFGEGIRK
jgi:hypothetical protein